MSNKPILEDLLKAARDHEMSPEEREAQRISFALGNARISNPRVTREMVESAAKSATAYTIPQGTGEVTRVRLPPLKKVKR